MKLISRMLIAIMIIILVAQVGMTQISVEQAKQSIRSFEGNPSLELPEPTDETIPFRPTARSCYRFYLPDRSYYVDKETGHVVGALYSLNQPDQGIPISQEQAIQIARQFLEQRSVVYQQYRDRMVFRFPTSSSYIIEFVERLPENGAYTYNMCFVELHPYTGSVIVFDQSWEGLPHPDRTQQPIFTAEEAANSIAAYFGFNYWDFDREPELLALPADWAPFKWRSSGLVWSLDIIGDGGRGVLGFVDAMTGDILMTDKYRTSLSPYPKVSPPKVRLWVYGTERIEETPLGDLPTADGFALKGITPIIQQVRYGSEFTWLPLEVFRRFGAKVKEAKGKIILSTEQVSKVIDKPLKSNGHVYLPAKLLEEMFPGKVIAVTTYEEGWVKITVTDKGCLKPFEDLREEINILVQKLRYKTKYRSFLDRREWQWGLKVGTVITVIGCLLSFFMRRRSLRGVKGGR